MILEEYKYICVKGVVRDFYKLIRFIIYSSVYVFITVYKSRIMVIYGPISCPNYKGLLPRNVRSK
jgi:hypothetical protein